MEDGDYVGRQLLACGAVSKGQISNTHKETWSNEVSRENILVVGLALEQQHLQDALAVAQGKVAVLKGPAAHGQQEGEQSSAWGQTG